MAFRQETAKPLDELVDVLLCGSHSLSPGERELIATYVSSEYDCRYCQTIHGAIAAHHLGGDEALVLQVKSGSGMGSDMGEAEGAAVDRAPDRSRR
jgi:AhpD family alkylhydroperoxidase